MRILKFIAICLLVLFVGAFSILNAQSVQLHYFIASRQLPLALLLVVFFVLGLLCSVLIGGAHWMRYQRKQHALKRELKLAQLEISNLRTMPIKDEH